MDQGRIIHQGHFDELKDLEYFRVMLDKLNQSKQYDSKEEEKFAPSSKNFAKDDIKDDDSDTSRSSIVRGSTINNDENKENIIVNLRSFYKFFFYSWWTLIAIICLIALLYLKRQTMVQFDYYLLKWVKYISETHKNSKKRLNKVLFYGGAYFASIVTSTIIQVVFIFTITVSLFRKMIKRIMYAPVNMYFDITPSGVILNRFSKDFRIVEIELTSNVVQQIGNVMSITITIVLAAYSFIWILVIVPVVVFSLIF